MKSDSNSDLACQSYAGLNLRSCILICVFHEAHILFWNTLLPQTPPDFLPWYRVVRLLKVYKHQVQCLLHFPVFLYHLPRCKYSISCLYQLSSARHQLYLSVVLCSASVVSISWPLPGMKPDCSSPVVSSLSLLSNILSHILMV